MHNLAGSDAEHGDEGAVKDGEVLGVVVGEEGDPHYCVCITEQYYSISIVLISNIANILNFRETNLQNRKTGLRGYMIRDLYCTAQSVRASHGYFFVIIATVTVSGSSPQRLNRRHLGNRIAATSEPRPRRRRVSPHAGSDCRGRLFFDIRN